MCREPAGMPAEALAGAWFATFWASLGRGSVSTSLAEAGAFEASASHLRQSSAVDFVSMSTIEGLQAGAIVVVVASICTQQLDGVNKTELGMFYNEYCSDCDLDDVAYDTVHHGTERGDNFMEGTLDTLGEEPLDLLIHFSMWPFSTSLLLNFLPQSWQG